MTQPVRELTAAIASGDKEALAALFRQHFDSLYGEARRITGRDESFCLDVVQDAFMRVIRSIPIMETEARLRRWLSFVVRSCAYDRLRQMARRRHREESVAVLDDGGASHDELSERLGWLERELATMDDLPRQLLVLRYRLGWTLKRIAAVTGLKPGAVDGRLGRALAGLRRRGEDVCDE